jgi:RNA polymerase sigma-70 factor, ECF subfamily
VDPADRVTLDDNVRLALLVVLERLSPAECVVFVLHDVFQVPFDAVADTMGRSVAACRQLASRARRKVEEPEAETSRTGDVSRHRLVTNRFIAACARGDLEGLLEVLDPEVSGTLDVRSDLVVRGAGRVGANLMRFWGPPPPSCPRRSSISPWCSAS